MLVEFSGDDELLKLLPDGGFIQLIGFDDAVDGTKNVPREEVLNFHTRICSGNKPESPIVRIALQFAEQAERLSVVAPRVEQNQRRLPHDRMQVVEQRMRPQKGPGAANS